MARAFDILCNEYRGMVLTYLRALVGDEHLAEDLAQETLLAAHRRLDTFDETRPFGPWLRGIARNVALHDRRAERRRPLLFDSAVVEGMEQVYGLFDHTPGPWGERIDKVRECIARLNDNLRAAVTAVYERGWTLRQAAAALGIGFDAVAQRLSRGRQAIRRCVEQSLTRNTNKETEHV